MMGERRVMQEALFYGFSRERHVPDNHLAMASGLRGRRGAFAPNFRSAYAVDARAHEARCNKPTSLVATLCYRARASAARSSSIKTRNAGGTWR